jgi:Carboxypeptidase regulatory-like domain/TonB dependent receptor
MKRAALLIVVLLVVAISAGGQTFRGAINGTVTDPSAAMVPNATVKATDKATGIERATVTTSDGLFAFQDLPVGTYKLTVTATGFPVLTVDNILVAQGAIYTVPVKLALSQQATVIEVSAAALSLDTTTETQTTLVTGTDFQTMPQNGRDFTQLIEVVPGYAGYAAGGYGSLNGTRANQVNWQIDGVDNNDLWHNVPAVNQGGVSGIAGIVLPVDAIDQFSVQTQAAPEAGRNPGGTVDLALKSGGNSIHGTAYYFNRNEAYAAASPFVSTKKENRNYQYGFSVGGPFIKDRLFYFATFEKQRFTIGLPGLATEPSADYQALAKQEMAKFGVTSVNPVSAQLLANLWPSNALSGVALPNNYSSPDPEFGYSHNGLTKFDVKINDKNTLSFHYFVGQGNQVAPVGGSALSEAASELKFYYEVAPIHVSNYAIAWNSALSTRWSNQVLAGVNYFRQIFSDENNGFVVSKFGLLLAPNFNATGLTGAPNIQIVGFDGVGQTPPEGREDITGHLTDTVSYTVGKHQFRFGGEFRRAQLEEFYHRHGLGSFRFDGTQGPWAGDTTVSDPRVLALADFLGGYLNPGRSSIALGDPTRLVFVHSFALFAQDAWQVNRKLTVNYGLRWDYEGPPGNDKKNMSVFIPSKGGLVFQGAGISTLYPQNYKDFSPRLGFAYRPKESGDLVVRGGFGIYFDTPNLNPFLDNRPANGAPNGVEGNPAGPSPVDTVGPVAGTSPFVANNAIFPAAGAVCPTGNGCGQVYNIFSVSQNFRNAYNYNYNLNIEKSLGKSLLLQVGYVGSAAHRLLTTQDINQPALSPAEAIAQAADDQVALAAALGAQLKSRPFYAQFPDFGIINQIESNANSNYNSFQTSLRIREWHRFSGQFTYTWAHALDDMSAYRGAVPQNSFDIQGDYGNSDFDTRHNFTSLLNYDLPSASRMRLLLNGWQLSSLLSFHTGQPFNITTNVDTTGTDEGVQRVDLIGNPYAGVSRAFNKGGVQWINPAAFAAPAPGTYGTLPRNFLYGPGFGDVDFSVVKNTRITERISAQFRIEMFNLFNRTNLAPPSGGCGVNSFISATQSARACTVSSGLGLTADTIGDFNGAPGIGPGEAFNMQLALKILF